jgi:hypothetical protein
MPEDAEQGKFRITMMFHPSHRVTSLDEVEQFFDRVFGCPSVRLADVSTLPHSPDNRTDYSIFTTIKDVVFDSIDPKLLIKGGVQRYPTVHKPKLNGLGWFVEGAAEAYHTLRRKGFDIVNQVDEPATGDEPPTVIGGPLVMFWTTPDSAGLRYQLLPPIPFKGDPRVAPDWKLAPVSDDEPLGIERCAYHTIVTDRPERAIHLFETLGGTRIHEGRDDVRGADCTYVHLADAVYQIAVPDEGTPAHNDWSIEAPNDTYHALTFKIDDLDRVERHLVSGGVGIRTRTEDAIVTDPETSIGIPWGFVTELVPGDTRS